MAVDRVAQRRTGAAQILAIDPSRRHHLSTPDPTRQTTPADRARLSGAQARDWARAFRGPRWRGFHHHATLRIAAYGFLVSEREIIPPQALVPPCRSRNLPFPEVIDPEAPPLRTQRH